MKDTKIHLFYSFLSMAFLVFMPLQTAFSETEYRVRSSDNLGEIVNKFYPVRKLTRQQIMVSIFRENPDAFSDNNIHFLLRNETLVLPNESDLNPPSIVEAQAVMLGNSADKLGDSAEKERTALREEIKVSQKKQEEKIRRLENESSELKRRLEQLVEAKTERDQQLEVLEEAIDKSSEQSIVSFSTEGMSKEVIKRVQKFKEENKTLQKELRKTRSALAENTRSTISLERRLKNVENKPKSEQQQEVVFKKNKDEIPKSLLDKLQASASENVIWLILLLLLAGFWFLFSRMRKKKNLRSSSAYDDDLSTIKDAYGDASDEFDPHYEEDSLEAGIKIDMAKAYLEMGDSLLAQDTLTEVLVEGSFRQKEIAKDILDGLGQRDS